MSVPSSQDLFSQEPEIATQESELRSGLRSSEIGSQLSYSELSSVDPVSTQIGATQHEHRSTDIGDIPRNVIYGTNVNIADVMLKFKKFLQEFKLDSLPFDENFVSDLEFNSETPYYIQKLHDASMVNQMYLDINGNHIKAYSTELFHNLVTYPTEVIPAFDTITKSVYASCPFAPEQIIKMETRPFNCSSDGVQNLRSLTPSHLNQIVTISGLVYRLTSVIPEVIDCVFQCTNCWQTVSVTCENQSTIHPEFCENCRMKYTMNMKHNMNDYIDKQIIKLQECPDEMPIGETPQTITMFAYQQLVDSVQPGDRVVVTGIYRSSSQRENPRRRNIKAVLNTYLDILHINKTTAGLSVSENLKLSPDRIEEIKNLSKKTDLYDRLSRGIAPSVYENEDIKRGLLLQLFGGNAKHGRGDIHILLCGDPGTSKSQLLQYTTSICPRSQYTSGKGVSGAGLTAYITHDTETKHAVLQAGSLVLADNGICCIDEFDKMADATRSVLHEVMEQQTLSIAKAGIICQMNARTSVLAASNPVGSKWDTNKTIIENIKLPPTLLSRFDLIFLMLNPQNEMYDSRLAKHLISLYQGAQNNGKIDNDDILSMDLIRDYIAYARSRVHPVMSKGAVEYLCDEYVSMRKASTRGQVAAYPRQLESLRRLSEAHARMRLSDQVEVMDCEEARRLQREALKQSAVDPVTGLIDVSILATGVSGGIRRKREELANVIYDLVQNRGVKTIHFQQLLEEVRSSSDRMISRELFEDALNVLKVDSKVEWAGKIIRFK